MTVQERYYRHTTESDAPVYQRPRAYYEGDERITWPDNGQAYRVFREFTKPYPTIARDELSKPQDRGGRMPDEWWANESSK